VVQRPVYVSDDRVMENAHETARYVVSHYGHLMTEIERRAQRHLSATMKATHGRSDVAAQGEAQTHRVHSRFLSNEPEVLRLVSVGYEAFAERTAARILKEHGDKVFLNRCPQCGGLARTPRAKQCRFCGHNWHSKRD
jgi:hypothetical protein